jgi:hypothetical protein
MTKKIGIMILSVLVIGGFVAFKAYRYQTLPVGCKKSLGISGCFGTNLTKNLKYENAPECLVISHNDCNYATLELNNKCPNEVTLEQKVLEPRYNYLVFTLDEQGKSQIVEPNKENWLKGGVPNPEKNQDIKLIGIYEGKEFYISYTRTKSLCKIGT